MLFLAMWTAVPVVHAADTERIIVTNAHLIGRDAPSEDVRVNLLIVDGKLAVVTKDELVIQPGDVAVDASGGFLFGELVLGKSPSFVILDRDPREDFDVLLDTEAHVRFAMQAGAIVMNELPEVPPAPPEATPKAVPGGPTRRHRWPSRFGTTTAGSGTRSAPRPSRVCSPERSCWIASTG